MKPEEVGPNLPTQDVPLGASSTHDLSGSRSYRIGTVRPWAPEVVVVSCSTPLCMSGCETSGVSAGRRQGA